MIVKKINNNVAIGVDGNGHEVVLFGKGIGFGELPYSINDMSKIERSFYDIDYRYYNLLSEIPENMFLFTSRIVDAIESKIDGNLNPNLVLTLQIISILQLPDIVRECKYRYLILMKLSLNIPT